MMKKIILCLVLLVLNNKVYTDTRGVSDTSVNAETDTSYSTELSNPISDNSNLENSDILALRTTINDLQQTIETFNIKQEQVATKKYVETQVASLNQTLNKVSKEVETAIIKINNTVRQGEKRSLRIDNVVARVDEVVTTVNKAVQTTTDISADIKILSSDVNNIKQNLSKMDTQITNLDNALFYRTNILYVFLSATIIGLISILLSIRKMSFNKS